MFFTMLDNVFVYIDFVFTDIFRLEASISTMSIFLIKNMNFDCLNYGVFE
jgi:hypothetical protein